MWNASRICVRMGQADLRCNVPTSVYVDSGLVSLRLIMNEYQLSLIDPRDKIVL